MRAPGAFEGGAGKARTAEGHRGAPAGHLLAAGFTDLMTSLAVVFMLLLVATASAPRPFARIADPPPSAAPPQPARAEPLAVALEELQRLGVVPEADAVDPHALRLIVPEHLLRFELGKSALTDAAETFLREIMPVYARAVCGPLRDRVAGVVIEGHTDDQGGDAMNLRLSQERSFRVLVRGLEVLQTVEPDTHECFAALASASGRGKQELIYDAERRLDRGSSRRVVFKILFRG